MDQFSEICNKMNISKFEYSELIQTDLDQVSNFMNDQYAYDKMEILVNGNFGKWYVGGKRSDYNPCTPSIGRIEKHTRTV